MAWTIEYSETAKRALAKLDPQIARKITDYMSKRVALAERPGQFGKPLVGSMSGLWRYRIADYRAVCRIEESHIVVVVLKVGHRRDVYE